MKLKPYLTLKSAGIKLIITGDLSIYPSVYNPNLDFTVQVTTTDVHNLIK